MAETYFEDNLDKATDKKQKINKKQIDSYVKCLLKKYPDYKNENRVLEVMINGKKK